MIQTENKDFARDINTKALVNTNHQALAEHKYRMNQAKQMERIKEDIDFLMQQFIMIKKALEDMRVTNG
jgi:hypothetical protein